MKRVVEELQRFVRSAFWLVPVVVINTSGFPDDTIAFVATATGVLWQLVHRRDLADRLSVLALLWTVGTIVDVAWPGFSSAFELSPMIAIVGLVLGLAASEQVLRFLDGRRILRDLERTRRDEVVPA